MSTKFKLDGSVQLVWAVYSGGLQDNMISIVRNVYVDGGMMTINIYAHSHVHN